MTEDWQNGGFGLYIHWPYCQAKCPYCDFNSHVSREIDQARWQRAYLSEIDRIGALTKGRKLDTVFFGGGTPSLMEPDLVAAVLARIRQTWALSNDPEITLEANPGSVEAGRFRAYAEAGVTRVSMGVQALNDADLHRLGRIHTVAEARRAFDIARDAFDRVSFDLIYARQNQTAEDWRTELNEALSMAVDHLSLYQLTIEPGTAFGDRHARGRLRGLPGDTLSADLYAITQDVCEAGGLPAYEVSNHAKPGAESRHNLIYWRYGDYAGIGPGAHGRLTLGGIRSATDTDLSPDLWLSKAEAGDGTSSITPLDPQDQAFEYMMMCLRLREGLDVQRFEALAGMPIPPVARTDLARMGMITDTGARIAATDQGRMVLNAVLRELLPDALA